MAGTEHLEESYAKRCLALTLEEQRDVSSMLEISNNVFLAGKILKLLVLIVLELEEGLRKAAFDHRRCYNWKKKYKKI